MSSYKLTYFNGRGRGEIARMLFAAAGKEFEDVRIEFPDWPKLKSSKYNNNNNDSNNKNNNIMMIK